MALTITNRKYGYLGDLRYTRATIAFDSSYPTGGESLTAVDLGLKTIDLIQIQSTAGVVFEYDYTNSKLKAYAQGVLVGAAGSETMDDFPVTAGVGVSADTHISAKAGSGTVGLGTLKELPNTNDASSVTGVRVFAIGV